jgi:flavin reductase (DIM6/NTAB) family NADH-FMN oxidoreductase RutF
MEKLEFKAGNMLYPLPVVMVSSQREGERPNIVTLAWAGTINSDPPMLSVSVRPERYSYGIIMDTREFVVNLTTENLVKATDYCGVKSGRDQDKFAECGLTPSPSRIVKAPGIAESPVNLECRVKEVLPLGSHVMFLADIVAVNVSAEYMEPGGRFRLNDTKLITYSHGEYFSLGQKLGSFGFSVRKN